MTYRAYMCSLGVAVVMICGMTLVPDVHAQAAIISPAKSCSNDPPVCPPGEKAAVVGQTRSLPPACIYECQASTTTPKSPAATLQPSSPPSTAKVTAKPIIPTDLSSCQNTPPACPVGQTAIVVGQTQSLPPSCIYECQILPSPKSDPVKPASRSSALNFFAAIIQFFQSLF